MLNALSQKTLSHNVVMRRLYQGKCEQLAKATVNSLRYRILKIEAEALLAEITLMH